LVMQPAVSSAEPPTAMSRVRRREGFMIAFLSVRWKQSGAMVSRSTSA
jgi:hypothetical protein